jgi:hypothetical protein
MSLSFHRAVSSPANLLVVFLLVTLYKPSRGRSNEIFPRAWAANSRSTEEAGLQPGGHDFLRLLRPTLAADRSRPAYHNANGSPNL